MIKKIEIENFKCLDEVSLPLSNITVLAGLNGMGKSTFMQSILLLHQSAIEAKKPLSNLICKGRWVDIGRDNDVLWEGANSEQITFYLHTEKKSYSFSFTLDKSTGEFVANGDYSQDLQTTHGIFTDNFHYLRAERWGPRTSLPINNEEVRVHRQFGRDGEYTAYFLSEYGIETVQNKKLHHPEGKSTQLLQQTEAWLGEISPGARLYTTSHEELDLVSLQFAFASAAAGETNHYRPTNVGFGISYVLPIIVAALSAEPGTMLLVENPEAHLHPRGQRKIAELLARAATNGVQIVVETHSDHFLNGLRLSAHSGNVPPENIQLHYFEREQTEYAIRAKVRSPKIDRNGRIDFWPDGFFDESEKALRELLRPAQQS
jgi:predicted ATPase